MRLFLSFLAVLILSGCSHLDLKSYSWHAKEEPALNDSDSDSDSEQNEAFADDQNADSTLPDAPAQLNAQSDYRPEPQPNDIPQRLQFWPETPASRVCRHVSPYHSSLNLIETYWPPVIANAHNRDTPNLVSRLAPKNSDLISEPMTLETNLWDRLRAGFGLDLEVDNKRIAVQLDWYRRNPAYLERTFNRAARYLFFITEALEKNNMPLELALLPVVESAFDPFAYSHGRASGLWQFIPGTGKIYGMHQNWWYDGRRDVLASTQGAIDYLSFLNGRFDGNWLHALASYNTGSGRVARAIRNNKKRGKPTDFWHLKLPRETRAYVPKLLAISKIVADPERYGVSLPDIANEPVFEVVTFDSQIDLAQAASLAQIEIEELYRLNPGFNQWATPPNGPHRLLLPKESSPLFEEALSQLPKRSRVSWSRYSVKSGDSLIKIAKRFNTTPAVIRQVNRLKNNTIRVKQKLLIPSASQSHEFYDLSSSNRLNTKQQRIKAPKGTVKIKHVVKPGDTMWELSLKHKVGMRSIAKWNGMAPTDVLKPGTTLLIYSKTAPGQAIEPEYPLIPGEREMIRKVGYRVRRGDSLARIASKFGVTVHQLVSWNKLNQKKYLQPGQKLTIFVDITRG